MKILKKIKNKLLEKKIDFVNKIVNFLKKEN